MSHPTETRRATAPNAPARRQTGAAHRESAASLYPRRELYRVGYYGQRERVGTLGRIGLLLAANRALPPGERIRWGYAMLTMAALFVCAAGLAVLV